MCRTRPQARARQAGVALVTALLVVAIATVAAVAMASRQQLDIRRTGSLLHSEQAWAYAIGAEVWAKAVLQRDRKDNEIDTLAEAWSTQPPVSFVEGGTIVGRLLDLQARFNLNSLVDGGGTPNDNNIEVYQRLLRNLDLDEGLADALVDWIDADIDVRFPDGAEDDHYLLLETPYRAANRALADVSELRLVKGYAPEVLAALQPHVVALREATPINVNTAGAVVLSAVAEGLSIDDGQALADGRGEEGFDSVDKFTQEGILNGKELSPGLSVSTQWFLMVVEADIGQGRVRLASTIQRTGDGARVITRRREFFEPVTAVVAEDE